MRKSMILSALTLTLALTACTAPQPAVSSPEVILPAPAVTLTPLPAQPTPATGPQVSTTTGILVDFRAVSTSVTNHTGEMQRVCINAECVDVPAGYVATVGTGAKAVTKLSAFGAELTFNSSGSYMRPTGASLITTRRITTHSGTALQIGDNIPGQGEAWTDRAGDIQQLVIEHQP